MDAQVICLFITNIMLPVVQYLAELRIPVLPAAPPGASGKARLWIGSRTAGHYDISNASEILYFTCLRFPSL